MRRTAQPPYTFAGVALPRRVYEFVQALDTHRGRVMTHEQLALALYGVTDASAIGAMRNLVARARNALLGVANVETRYGIGYRLVASAMEPCARCRGTGFVEVGT
jgi:DNA-binding response OmpR family regulator